MERATNRSPSAYRPEPPMPFRSESVRRALRIRVALAPALSLGLAFAATGCTRSRTPEERPPDMIRAGAFARVESDSGFDEAPATKSVLRYAPLLEATFEAEAGATHPGDAGPRAQALAMAAAAARRNALRDLARQVLDSRPEDGSDRTMRDLVAENPSWRDRLTTAIESEATSTTFVVAAARTSARVRAEGAAIAKAMGIEAETRAVASPGAAPERPPTAEKARDVAREEALAKARAALLERLMGTRTTAGSLEELFARRAEARARLDAMIAELAPVSEDFGEDGICEIAVEFDRNRALELIEESR